MVFGMRHPCYRPQELPRVPFPGHPDRHTPADIRPAFLYDVDRCRRLLSDAYGCGETPFLDDCVVLLFGKETSPNGLSVVAHGQDSRPHPPGHGWPRDRPPYIRRGGHGRTQHNTRTREGEEERRPLHPESEASSETPIGHDGIASIVPAPTLLNPPQPSTPC